MHDLHIFGDDTISSIQEMEHCKNKMKETEGEIEKSNYTTLRKHIKSFEDTGKSPATIKNHIVILLKFLTAIKKPCSELTEIDLEDYFDSLTYAKNTKKLTKATIRTFLRKCNPELASGIKTEIVKTKLTPSDMFKLEDVDIFVQAAESLRDKALIATYFDSGARRSEVISIKIRDVEFDNYGAKVWLRESKTFERIVRLTYAAPYLRQWINCHPLSSDKDAYVFISVRTKTRISNTCLYHIINAIEKKTGKRPMPRQLRHSRATDLAKKLNGSEQKMKLVMGWTPNSNMASTYVHLSGSETDDIMLEAAGIFKEDEETKEVTYKCLRCHSMNPITERRCLTCGYSPDDPIIDNNEIEAMKKKMAELDEMMEIMKKVTEMSEERYRKS